MTEYDVIVIGGGMYGCLLGEALAARHPQLLVVEKEAELLTHASYWNQARVHRGYHYPRHEGTARGCAESFDRFMREFGDCVLTNYESVYAIAKPDSLVSAAQFEALCAKIGAPLERAPERVTRLFEPSLIEAVYMTEEHAFDGGKLRELLKHRLFDAGVPVRFNTTVERLALRPDGRIEVWLVGDDRPLCANHVLNCTYSSVNTVLRRSGLRELPMHYQLAEMVLTYAPTELRSMGVTVMDGPYFSIMPFPAFGSMHTLSHVTHTPQRKWSDSRDADVSISRRDVQTHYEAMVADSKRYVPCIERARYRGSFFEIKALLPWHDGDDGRPILFKRHEDMPNLFSVVGAKIDNVYDVADGIVEILDGTREGLSGDGRNVAEEPTGS